MPHGGCSILLRCSSRRNVSGAGAETWFCRLERAELEGSKGVHGGRGFFLVLLLLLLLHLLPLLLLLPPPLAGEGWGKGRFLKVVGRKWCKHSRSALPRIHDLCPNKLLSKAYLLPRSGMRNACLPATSAQRKQYLPQPCGREFQLVVPTGSMRLGKARKGAGLIRFRGSWVRWRRQKMKR